MDIATLLIGLAQIGVALAGFTTIAGVVVRVSKTTTENLLAVRMATILMFSVFVIVGAILPMVIYHTAPDYDRYWRLSSLVITPLSLVMAVIGTFYILPRTIRDTKNSWPQTLSSTACGYAGVSAIFFALFAQNAAFWYIAGLGLVLAGSLVMLVGLILSFPVFDILRKRK